MPDTLAQPPTTRPVPKQLVGHAFDKVSAMLAVQRRRELKAQRDAIPTPPALSQDPTLDDFNRLRLGRVRGQLEKLDAMMVKETDPQKLDRLASAQARLSEQERILAGRPLPGSRRPREDRGRVSAGWIELQPALPASAGQPPPAAPTTDVTCCAPAKPMGWEYDDPGASACGVDAPTGSVPSSIPDSKIPQGNPVQ